MKPSPTRYRTWLDPWPVWADETLGWVIRALLALGGLGTGLLFAWFGYFVASFGNKSPVWDADAVTLVTFGIVLAVPCLWLAIKPSRAAALTVLAAITGVFIAAWIVR